MTLREPQASRTDDAANAMPMRAPPHVRRGWWAGLGCGAGAAAVALSFAAHRAPYFASDLTITRWVQAADMSALDLPLRALNRLGFPPLVDVIYAGILLLLLVFGRRWEAAAGAVGALGSAGINSVVKGLVNRARPSAQLVHVEHHIANPTFPAGHVLNFTAFAGFLCCLVYMRMRPSWRRSSLVVLLLALIALMGVARIDSGEHWPSDVLGGYLLGALWLAVTVLFYDWGRHRAPVTRPAAAARAWRHVVIVAMATLSAGGFVSYAVAAPVDSDSLGATSEVPWNPPQPMARRAGWEQVLLLPGRIVSLPLSGLGYEMDHWLGRLEQSPAFANGLTAPPPGGLHLFRIRTSRMGDRTGLGGALEVRQDLLRGPLQSQLSAEYAGTLHRYNRTLLAWSGRPLSVVYGYEWRPQDRFYGVGNAAPEASVSDFAAQSEFVRAGLAWESNPARGPRRARSAVSVWGGPRSQVTRTGREKGTTSWETRFPALGAATLNRRVENLVYGVSLLNDRRLGAPHWNRGWSTLLSAERFDAPTRSLALHSGVADGAQFTVLRAQAEAGVSFWRDPRTIRLLVRIADRQLGANRDRLLVSDLSTLGGQAGLGGYSPGRFHDLDLLLTRLGYVFPLERRLEVELHSEWGAVYPNLWSDAKLNTLHHSFGFLLRVRNDLVPRGSVGLDWSREGMRIRFSFGGAE